MDKVTEVFYKIAGVQPPKPPQAPTTPKPITPPAPPKVGPTNPPSSVTPPKIGPQAPTAPKPITSGPTLPKPNAPLYQAPTQQPSQGQPATPAQAAQAVPFAQFQKVQQSHQRPQVPKLYPYTDPLQPPSNIPSGTSPKEQVFANVVNGTVTEDEWNSLTPEEQQGFFGIAQYGASQREVANQQLHDQLYGAPSTNTVAPTSLATSAQNLLLPPAVHYDPNVSGFQNFRNVVDFAAPGLEANRSGTAMGTANGAAVVKDMRSAGRTMNSAGHAARDAEKWTARAMRMARDGAVAARRGGHIANNTQIGRLGGLLLSAPAYAFNAYDRAAKSNGLWDGAANVIGGLATDIGYDQTIGSTPVGLVVDAGMLANDLTTAATGSSPAAAALDYAQGYFEPNPQY